jgi:putative phage-type endonuclease
MRVIDVVQGTDEWATLRAGKITGSQIENVLMDSSKAGYRNYLARLVAERMTGVPYEGFQSKEMQWGIETEPLARQRFSMEFHDVDTVGFVLHPEFDFAGVSPDGLCYVVEKGVEFKCPNTATHFETIETGRVPAKYFGQCQWAMACTGWGEWEYVSFDPRVKVASLQMYVIPVKRDDRWIENATQKVIEFNRKVDEKIARLMEKAQP